MVIIHKTDLTSFKLFLIYRQALTTVYNMYGSDRSHSLCHNNSIFHLSPFPGYFLFVSGLLLFVRTHERFF